MTIELMEHQKEGISFLSQGRHGLLAYEQGLGKTLVAIDSFRSVWANREAERLLVICPNSLKRNWVAEFKKFCPEFSVEIVEGPPKIRRKILAESDSNVVIMSYETARGEVSAILSYVKTYEVALVLDESHAAKNWKSLTSSAVRQISPYCKFRWLLSGTPVTNAPTDLYTQIDILAPGENLLGSQESFLATIQHKPETAYIRDTFDRLILRKTKEQCLDLPAKSYIDIKVDLPAWQRKLYDDMRTKMVCDIQSMTGEQYRAFAPTALSQLTRLIQIASNPALLMPDLSEVPGKFDVIDGLVEDIVSVPGRKVIIWSNYIKS